MDFQLWLAFVAASTALLLIPGPTVLLVLSYALSQGRRVALATVAGVALGDFIAMTASLAGLGALVLTSAKLFIVLKWIGAAYLVYLGVKLFRSAGAGDNISSAAPAPLAARHVFLHAMAVTALNPKSIAFFIAFVPQFIVPEAPLFPQFSTLVVTFVGLAAFNALVYALMADHLRARLTSATVTTFLPRLGGGSLIAMGLATATLKTGDVLKSSVFARSHRPEKRRTSQMIPDAEKVLIYAWRGNRTLVFDEPDFPEVPLQVPGGTMEHGEIPIEAARRELFEETGLALNTGWSAVGSVDYAFMKNGDAHHPPPPHIHGPHTG